MKVNIKNDLLPVLLASITVIIEPAVDDEHENDQHTTLFQHRHRTSHHAMPCQFVRLNEQFDNSRRLKCSTFKLSRLFNTETLNYSTSNEIVSLNLFHLVVFSLLISFLLCSLYLVHLCHMFAMCR